MSSGGDPSWKHLSPRHEAHTALDVITLLPALERPRNEAPYPSYLPGMFAPLRCLRRPHTAHHAEALPGPAPSARGNPTGEDRPIPTGRNESVSQISAFQITRSDKTRLRKHGGIFPDE